MLRLVLQAAVMKFDLNHEHSISFKRLSVPCFMALGGFAVFFPQKLYLFAVPVER